MFFFFVLFCISTDKFRILDKLISFKDGASVSNLEKKSDMKNYIVGYWYNIVYRILLHYRHIICEIAFLQTDISIGKNVL